MPTINMIKNSDFDPERIGRVFSENHGIEITTDGILEGWAEVSTQLDACDFDELIMQSPEYIRELTK